VCGLASEAAPFEVVISARVNQQPPMHQLAVLSTGWVVSFHLASDGVHHSPFYFLATDHCIFFLFFSLCDHFSSRPDFTHSYHAHFLTLVSTTPTLVPYLLSPIDIATLITSYRINLATVLTKLPS